MSSLINNKRIPFSGEVLLKTSSCGRFYSSALPIMRQQIADQLEEIRHAGTFKSERVITSKQDNLITVEGSDQPVLNFCANNYLGLSVSFVHLTWLKSELFDQRSLSECWLMFFSISFAKCIATMLHTMWLQTVLTLVIHVVAIWLLWWFLVVESPRGCSSWNRCTQITCFWSQFRALHLRN